MRYKMKIKFNGKYYGALFLILLFLVLPSVLAINEEFNFERGSNPTLQFSCVDGFKGLPCDANYECNLSIGYPNGTLLYNSSTTQAIRNGENYELELENLTTNGFYSYGGFCTNGTDSATSNNLNFKVSQTGMDFDEGKGLASLGIMGGVIALAFIFMLFAFKLSANPKTFPIAFVFIILTLILGMYFLQLGVAYSHDILEYENVSGIQQVIFTTVLWLVVSVGIISFILFGISFIKAMGRKKTLRDFGEDFDPINEVYN